MTKPAWLTSLILLLAASDAWTCTLGIGISGPQHAYRGEYILSGIVAGHVGPFSSSVLGEIWGVKVRSLEVVVSPKLVTEVEVFSYGLRDDCALVPMPLRHLEEMYAVGSAVIVVGYPSTEIPAEDGIVRLEVSAYVGGLLSPTHLAPRDVAHRVIDYEELSRLDPAQRELLGFGRTTSSMDFEMHKEYERLRRAECAEALEILDRLKFHHWFDLPELAEEFVGTRPEAVELIAEWRARLPRPQRPR
jgi:hypothetical protein